MLRRLGGRDAPPGDAASPRAGAPPPHAGDRTRTAVRRGPVGRACARGARRVRGGARLARRRDRLPRRPARRRARAARRARVARADPRSAVARADARTRGARVAHGALLVGTRRTPDRRRHLRRAPVQERQHRRADGPRVRRATAAEHAVHARHVGVDLRRRLDQHDGDAGADPRVPPSRGRLPAPPDVRGRRVRGVDRRRACADVHRGRRHARDRQRRRPRRHRRTHPSRGGRDPRDAPVQRGRGDAGDRGRDPGAAVEHAPRHGPHPSSTSTRSRSSRTCGTR